MLKLIAISCVIVVASLNFQKVKGFNLIPSIPNVIKNPIPNAIKNPIPNIIENPISNIIKNPIPNIIENPISNIINNPISKIIEDPLSNIIKNPISKIIENPIPNIIKNNSISKIIKNPIPDIQNLIPDIQNLIPNISSINPLNIGGNDISNIIKNISKLGTESVLKGILGKIMAARATCMRAFTEGHEIFIQLSSIFNTCVIKQIKNIPSPKANIKKLSNLASDVQKILTEDVHDTLQCLQQSPVNIVSCLNITKHLSDPNLNIKGLLSDVISEILSIFPFNLIKYIPGMIACGEKLAVELINIPKLFKFLIDAGLCAYRVRSLI